jgi:hypothetical protein
MVAENKVKIDESRKLKKNMKSYKDLDIYTLALSLFIGTHHV